MYLKRLDLMGFKTFAQKTSLMFASDEAGARGVTAVVGPNGSGKSNIADAVRWVMGEQSLKLLRGKASEDVIFSGSHKRARAGMAEVTITFANDDNTEIPMSEIAITRRLTRDGSSEYEINKQSARLQDVTLLLAQCGVAQRSYSVIGQGMVDQVLAATPSERREFFDEAFGLRPYQLKRTQSLHKIEAARQHLMQTEVMLQELEPRLQILERQAKRFAERDRLQTELLILERQTYGYQWHTWRRDWSINEDKLRVAKQVCAEQADQVQKGEKNLKALADQVTPDDNVMISPQRREVEQLQAELLGLREQELRLETRCAVAAVRAEKPWSPLSLSGIIEAVESLHLISAELDQLLQVSNPDVTQARELIKTLRLIGEQLLVKLQRPAPEPTTESLDMALELEVKQLAMQRAVLMSSLNQAREALLHFEHMERVDRQEIFAAQRQLSEAQRALSAAEHNLSSLEIERARLEARREALLLDLREHAPALEIELEQLPVDAYDGDGALIKIRRLRTQLEWIGGIDPQTVQEYTDTKVRYEQTLAQVSDVRETIVTLEAVVHELDRTIRERGEQAFESLNKEFAIYFRTLFGGGEASIVEWKKATALIDGVDNNDRSEVETGVDILANPPGKRSKAIALLSGGERALTAIALICAIMSTNPSPFVVLDEVDAALDEANSRRFADILSKIALRTQCIVVTHNRATMHQANVLYGVTMGEDGVSTILSVKMEDDKKPA